MHHLQVVLVEPEIPPNTGAIARVCAATDTVLHLVEPLGFKLDDKSLKRAGMDYWEHVMWHTWPNLVALRAAHPEGKFHFLTTKTERAYTDARFEAGDFLVFGRETKGLPESLLRENAETCLTIPMSNANVRSLNLATAASIVLFEAIRQLREPAQDRLLRTRDRMRFRQLTTAVDESDNNGVPDGTLRRKGLRRLPSTSLRRRFFHTRLQLAKVRLQFIHLAAQGGQRHFFLRSQP